MKMMFGMEYNVPTENRFMASYKEDMAREGYQIVDRSKRKRTNTGQSDSDRAIFKSFDMDDKLNVIFEEIRSLRADQQQTSRGMLNFQNSFRCMGESLNCVIQTTNRNTDMLKTLAYKSIDLEARSRRNNLIFWGLAENVHENCFAVIRDFIKNELDLDSDKMYLARAHRLGNRKHNVRVQKRPLIVNFRDFCDTEAVMSKAFLLRGTPFSVDYDLPKEINQARKSLWTELKSIKSRRPGANAQIIYPAKLVVDGRIVCDKFPDWSEALRRDRLGDFSHIDSSVVFDQPGANMSTQMCADLGMSRVMMGGGDTWSSENMDICSVNGSVDAARCNGPVVESVHTGEIVSAEESAARDAETQPPPMDSTTSAFNISDLCEGGASNLPPLPPSPPSPDIDLPTSNSQKNNSEIFRPYIPSASMNTNKQYVQTRSQSDSRGERGSHVSRAMHRGSWRKSSPSVEKRSVLGATGTNQSGKPKEDGNRLIGGKNSMTLDRNSHGTSKSVSKSPHGSKNRHDNENDMNR